ncbi:MAG: hypothetical protein AAF430_12810 [Myxococcota bacterium]
MQPQDSHSPVGAHRRLLGAFLAGLAALLLAGPALAGGSVRLVILPIVVHSAAPDASYVSRGISDMISSRLEQDGTAQTLRLHDASAGTTELSKALDQGRTRGADYVIFGSFTQFGDGASLDIHCVPVLASEAEAAAARRIFIQSGTVGDIIPKLDEIVDRVALYVQAQAPPMRAGAPAPDPAAAGVRADAALLRDLVDRLEALEKAVYQNGATTNAAQVDTEVPES